MTHFRNRVGDEALETLLQETLAAAHRAGALSVRATEAVAVDTTVQEKAIAHPTEHGLMLAAIEHVGRQAKKAGLNLRQSYVRVARHAAMKTGRYLHAQQKKRARAAVEIYARAAPASAPRRAAQDANASRFIGADGETAGERAGSRLAHRAPEAR